MIVAKGKDPVGWNIVVGGIIADAMSANEIPEEIKHALLNIEVDFRSAQIKLF